MGSSFDYGLQRAEARRLDREAHTDEQRRVELENALQNATTPEERNAVIHDAYAKDPSKVKQFVENLGRRLVGKQPTQAASPYAAPSTTSNVGAVTNPETGETISAGQPVTVRGPAPKTRQEAFAGHAARGRTPEQQQEDKFSRELAAREQSALTTQKAKGELEQEQAQQNVQNFAETYKRMTGSDPSPEMLQAFTVSAFGGDKVLSTMQQAEALKARTEYQNATLQMRQAQADLNQAKFKATQDPNNPLFRLRLQQASTAYQNMLTKQRTAEARYQGTWNGAPIPGDIIDAEGNVIPPVNAANVRPTGMQRERATLATSAIDQMQDLKGLLSSRKDLFGPGAGRITNFRNWVGSQDPDAQKFKSAARVAADHLAGVFGGRSQAALEAIYDVIGNNITNPQAAIAGIEQMAKAADVIQGMGSYRTVGGGATPSPTGGKGSPAPKKTTPKGDDDLLKRLTDATGGASAAK